MHLIIGKDPARSTANRFTSVYLVKTTTHASAAYLLQIGQVIAAANLQMKEELIVLFLFQANISLFYQRTGKYRRSRSTPEVNRFSKKVRDLTQIKETILFPQIA